LFLGIFAPLLNGLFVWRATRFLISRISELGTGLETMTALVWAARNGIAEIVELLLDWGAAVEANDDDGIDALFLAAERSTRYGNKISNLLRCRGVLG
jgi:ankyrin repeat protein